jgi:[ribosomal protein S5]-alanine N-acetyltransferase
MVTSACRGCPRTPDQCHDDGVSDPRSELAREGFGVQLETGRLLLRPWRVSEAVVLHELWTERDPRVPPHRRIDADGRPTAADLENWIRTNRPSSIGLLAVERKVDRDVIGYCGLIDSGRGSGGEPELAFELLRRVWREGYATEASLAVLDWARSSGYERLWATVWEWNTASRRVLAKVGFTETERKELDAVYGNNLFTTRRL